jgi:hypothetical protein
LPVVPDIPPTFTLPEGVLRKLSELGGGLLPGLVDGVYDMGRGTCVGCRRRAAFVVESRRLWDFDIAGRGNQVVLLGVVLPRSGFH